MYAVIISCFSKVESIVSIHRNKYNARKSFLNTLSKLGHEDLAGDLRCDFELGELDDDVSVRADRSDGSEITLQLLPYTPNATL